MSDIVLTHGYFIAEDEIEQKIMKPYPPLGLLYVSAYLKQAGFNVEVFDTTFEVRDNLSNRLQGEAQGVLGIYTTHMTRKSVVEIISIANRAGWIVIIGGPDGANYPEKYLEHGAHIVVLGEGEATLAQLLPVLVRKGPARLHEVEGIVFRDETGQIATTPPRELLPIDSIPRPDRESVNLSLYFDAWRDRHSVASLNLITSRGCPYGCKWCSHSIFGYRHRQRDYLACADEVENLHEQYKPDQLWYADDIFTLDHKWVYQYAGELKKRRLRIPFETISRADRLMSEELLEVLAQMGCFRLWIGSESGSNRILQAMNRGVKAEQIQWVVNHARKVGIESGLFLMWGYEGETLQDIDATIEHLKAANPSLFFTTLVYPIKNTPYYNEVSEKIIMNKKWSESSDKDYKVLGRHSKSYYKSAERWLRSEVESHQLEKTDPARAAIKQAEAKEARRSLELLADETEA